MNQTFQGFHTDAALQWLGAEIKALSKHSAMSNQALSIAYHISKHTLYDV